jgi:hypothetical protein
MKKRITEFLAYLEIGQAKFEERVGLSRGFVNKMGDDNITIKTLDKIKVAYPELSIDWLVYGEGEMLKPGTAIARGKKSQAVSIGTMSGGIGAVGSGSVVYTGDKHETHNHNGDKNKAIEKLEEKDDQRQGTFTTQLARFHDEMSSKDKQIERKDGYIKEQDGYIASIIKHSYLRNQENMERIDELFRQQSIVLQQQDRIIELMVEQNKMTLEQSKRTQDRADALIEMLVNKFKS